MSCIKTAVFTSAAFFLLVLTCFPSALNENQRMQCTSMYFKRHTSKSTGDEFLTDLCL